MSPSLLASTVELVVGLNLELSSREVAPIETELPGKRRVVSNDDIDAFDD